jgi:hypothetical protein
MDLECKRNFDISLNVTLTSNKVQGVSTARKLSPSVTTVFIYFVSATCFDFFVELKLLKVQGKYKIWSISFRHNLSMNCRKIVKFV